MTYWEILRNTLLGYEELQGIVVQIAKLSPICTYNLARDMWVDRTKLPETRGGGGGGNVQLFVQQELSYAVQELLIILIIYNARTLTNL